ncbi:MAG: PH domain-containing protein [Tepidisphaerales bacterium]
MVYFSGRASLWSEAGALALHGGIALVVLGVSVVVILSVGGWTWLLLPPLTLLAAAIAVWPVVVNRTQNYRITNYRIDFERGLLTRRIDTLELWHVDDIKFRQSLLERVMGIGTLVVYSGDDSTPELHIPGLNEPRKMFDLLKQRVISVKRQRGVIKLDV